MKITGLKVGLIINFKRPKLEWERIVLENHSESFASLRVHSRFQQTQA
ncbi:MAG: hypothetical protein ACPGGN_02505 [Opitutales bacterium]